MNTQEVDPLAQYVGWRTARNVLREEIADALGLSRHTYRNRRNRGDITASDVITVARHYGLNEVDALVELGYLEPETIVEYVRHQVSAPDFQSAAVERATRSANEKATRITRKPVVKPVDDYPI